MEPDDTLIAEEDAGASARSYSTLARETLVYGAAAALQRFGGLVLVPVYARTLSQEAFGVVSLLLVTVALVGALASLQLDSAAHRWFFDTEDADDRHRSIASWLWTQLAVSTVVALVMIAAASPLSSLLFGTQAHANTVMLAALCVPAGVIGYATSTTLRLRRRAPALLAMAALTMAVTVGATLVFIGSVGAAGVFAGQLVAGVVASIAGLFLLGASASPRRVDGTRLRAMMRFALPLLPIPIASWILSSSDRYFVGGMVSVDAVALYQMGATVASIVALVTVSFSLAWNPWALTMHQRPDAPARYARAFELFVLGGTLLALAVSLVAEPVIRLLATERYVEGAAVVPWLAPAQVAGAAAIVAVTGSFIAKQARAFGAASYVGAVVTIVLNALLIPWVGMVGGAITTLVALLVVAAVGFWRSQRHLAIPFRFLRTSLVFALGVAVGLVGTRAGATPLEALLGFVAVAGIGALALGRAPATA